MSKNTNKNNVPFNEEQILKAASVAGGTPFYLYDEVAIRKNVRKFIKAFSWIPNFKEYYAVKACPNPYILQILKEEGCGMDCSSLGELVLSKTVGIIGEDIMFTSNNTPVEDFKKAKSLGAIINFDDITHIPFFKKHVGNIGELACCRYNPGDAKKGNVIIGNPKDAKYGMTKEQLFDAYNMLKKSGVTRFGIHTMVASNELDPLYFVETAKILFETVLEIEEKVGITFEFVNLGGGIGIPYKPEDKKVDLNIISAEMKKVYDELFANREKPLNIVMEMGRMITGPYGYLITTVTHLKNTYKDYIGTDASMSDLMRPGLYGVYHHITILGKENDLHKEIFDVTGSLCENNDKFAIDRLLSVNVDYGDILVIHDAGAHGHAMGFNYNAKLRPAEIMWNSETNTFKLIRRRQTLDDYFETLNFEGSIFQNLA
jgi:diaminopimelate decarboxylase